MAYPPIVIVDTHDKPIGLAMTKDAWAKRLLYRVVAIIVEDENGRILLQKRAEGLEVDPGKWDMSVGGHVDKGHTYESAAAEEMEEEIGLSDVPLRELTKVFLSYDLGEKHMNYFTKVFHALVPNGSQLLLGLTELSDARWFTREELAELLRQHPERCAKFLHELYARLPLMHVSYSTAKA
jgi:8-oxo-dGTP pyrophosphatase MutT (NUDIX family)